MSSRKVLFDTNRSKFLHIDDCFLRTVLGLPFEANITSMWAFVTLLFLNCFRCCAALIYYSDIWWVLNVYSLALKAHTGDICTSNCSKALAYGANCLDCNLGISWYLLGI